MFVTSLGRITRTTNIGARKIDGSFLKMYDIVSAGFSLQDCLKKVQFFEKISLLAKTNIEIVLEMPLLVFSNANIKFHARELT